MRVSATLAAGALALTLTSSVAPDRSPKPMRSDCIVGLRADWSAVSTPAWEVLEAIGRYFLHAKGDRPSASFKYDSRGSGQPSRMYFQFGPDCATKRERMSRHIAEWQAEGIELPQLEYIDEPILPGPQTIDSSGPLWADGAYYDYYNQWQNPRRGP